MIAVWLIAGVVAVAILLTWIDGLEFPDSLSVALDIIQTLVLLAVLNRLGHEDTPS